MPMDGPGLHSGHPCALVSVLRPATPGSPTGGSPNPPCQYFMRGPFNGLMMGADLPPWMQGPGPHMAPGEMMMNANVQPPASDSEMTAMMRQIGPLVPSSSLMQQQQMAAVGEQLVNEKAVEAQVQREEVGVEMVQHMKQMNDYMEVQLREDAERVRVTRWVIYVLVPAAILAVVLLCAMLLIRRRRQTAGYSTMQEFDPKGTA